MPLTPHDLGRLYRQHAPALRLFARQWPGCAEDAVQDAFVSLARQEPPPMQIVPWLYQVVRNNAKAATRSAWPILYSGMAASLICSAAAST